MLELAPKVLRALAARHPQRYPLLLDSAAEGSLSRFSILLAEPRAALWLDRAGTLNSEGLPPGLLRAGAGFLDTLEQWWLTERAPRGARAFAGGWAVYLGYELAAEIEPRLTLPPPPFPWRAFALRCPCALVHDRLHGTLRILVEPEAADSLPRIEADAQRVAETARGASGEPSLVEAIEEEPAQQYLARVRRAQDYIAEGQIYQANLSRAWRARLRPGAALEEVYERLRAANPAPFAAWAQWGGASILSSSPERLARIENGRIETRPIAGTRARSGAPAAHAGEVDGLLSHPKERAEHLMLVDLERNDLGRVCSAGSVRVEELMTIESYRHVHHIVSSVTGQLAAGLTPIAALRALFPGGTITGCPKIRCMQIIAELEGTGRGPFTGALGWLGRNGDADFNILIRTLWADGAALELRAGAGIVADSDPVRELAETRAKARGLLAALAPHAVRDERT
ncbi:MAG: aminodeoxychorismate synthase component I [Steroidobacteraceae bacterium]